MQPTDAVQRGAKALLPPEIRRSRRTFGSASPTEPERCSATWAQPHSGESGGTALLLGEGGAPAEAWADGSDEANAQMVAVTCHMADRVIPDPDREEILQRNSHATK
jgi:hypothetical protein